MSRAPSSPSTEPPAPKGPQASAPSLSIVQQRRRAVCINCRQRAFFCYERETMSQYFGSERGTVSPRTSLRKLRPVLNADSGKWFPQRVSRGKRVPLWTPIPGHRFPKAFVSESASHFEPSDWDALSGRGPKRKPHPALSVHSGMWLPDGGRCGNCIPFRIFKAGRAFP